MPKPFPSFLNIFTSYYYPAQDAGGIYTATEALISWLPNLPFRVFTRNVNTDNKPFTQTQLDLLNHNYITYSSLLPLQVIVVILRSLTSKQTLLLTSFFDPASLLAILLKSIFRLPNLKIIISPKGELASTSLSIGLTKKLLVIRLLLFTRSLSGIMWITHNTPETNDVLYRLSIRENMIHQLPELISLQSFLTSEAVPIHTPDSLQLKLLYLSRIAPEKQLHKLLNCLSQDLECTLDIYGSKSNSHYFHHCMRIIHDNDLKAFYKGSLAPSSVLSVLSRYDALVLPSPQESFGYVVAESLLVGTPVLITRLPSFQWIEQKQCGIYCDFSEPSEFADKLVSISQISRTYTSRKLIKEISHSLLYPAQLVSHYRSILF